MQSDISDSQGRDVDTPAVTHNTDKNSTEQECMNAVNDTLRTKAVPR